MSIEAGKESVEQSLLHYGVRGMRWGTRRTAPVSTTTRTDTGVIKRQTKVHATGGHSHPAHPDAVKAAEQHQRFKKSGAAALGNHELRDLSQRLQLEAQVSSLTTKKGKKFAQRQLESQGQQAVQRSLAKTSARAFKKARRGAAVAALA
jgi:hypothetical protein